MAVAQGNATAVHREINKRIVDSSTVEQILQTVSQQGNNFNAVNVATAAHRLAKLYVEGHVGHNAEIRPLLQLGLQQLSDLSLKQIKEFQGQGLGNVLWAFAKLGCDVKSFRPLLDAIAHEAVRRLSPDACLHNANAQLGAQSLSNLVYGYAVLGFNPGQRIADALAEGVMQQLRYFMPQGLSNIVWAYAKLGVNLSTEIQQLLSKIAAEAAGQLGDQQLRRNFIPQNLSNLVYGYAVLGFHPGLPLMTAVTKEAEVQIKNFGPQELVNLAWAVAKLGQPYSPHLKTLLDVLFEEAVHQLNEPAKRLKFKPQTMSNLLWAMATLDHRPKRRLLFRVVEQGLKQLDAFKPQEIANTMWSFATLDYYAGPEALAAIAEELRKQTSHFKPQELSNSVWAFASLRHHPGDAVMQIIVNESQRQLERFKSQELSNLIWGCAKLGFASPPFFSQASVRALSVMLTGFKAQDMCNTMWGLVTMDAMSTELLQMLAQKVSLLPVLEFSNEALVQLFQVKLALSPRSIDVGQLISTDLLRHAENAWRQALSEQSTKYADLRQEICDLLTELNVSYVFDKRIEDGLLSVDIAVDGQFVALEINGTSHFSINSPYQPLGKTVLRWRMLMDRGWKVLSVPFFKWNALRSVLEKKAFLQDLLQSQTSKLTYSPDGAAAINNFPSVKDIVQQLQFLPFGEERASQESWNSEELFGRRHSLSSGIVPPASCPMASPPPALDPLSCVFSPQQLPVMQAGMAGRSSFAGAAANTNVPTMYPPGLGVLPATAAAAVAGPKLWEQQQQLSTLSLLQPAAGSTQQTLPVLTAGFQHDDDSDVDDEDVDDCQSELETICSMLHEDLYMQRGRLATQSSGSSTNIAAAAAAAVGDRLEQKPDDLRRLFKQATQTSMDEPISTAKQEAPDSLVWVLKRIICGVGLEENAVEYVKDRLPSLSVESFCNLLKELSIANLAVRVWQLFNYVRRASSVDGVSHLCNPKTYSTMIALCGPWNQLRRAIELLAEMNRQGLTATAEVYTALIGSCMRCNELDLAADVYTQMRHEGFLDITAVHLVTDLFSKLGKVEELVALPEECHQQAIAMDVYTYNSIIVGCSKAGSPEGAIKVYQHMCKHGGVPNHKTFAVLMVACQKRQTSDLMALLEGLVKECTEEKPGVLWQLALTACEKSGYADVGVAVFNNIVQVGVQPDVALFNSTIAACAHAGEFVKAQQVFDNMAAHGCQPDAVSFANLIRAYKKGGQWCKALLTFEKMQHAGFKPHAAVYGSIIDLLWYTGVFWAQNHAAQILQDGLQSGILDYPAEHIRKGSVKLDLQALTVGAAVLSMRQWLVDAKERIAASKSHVLNGNNKLTIVNGIGKNSRGQSSSSLVKEWVGASLMGGRAPFKLLPEFHKSLRLEASTVLLKDWLFRKDFDTYLNMNLPSGSSMLQDPNMSTEVFTQQEQQLDTQCREAMQMIRAQERNLTLDWDTVQSASPMYAQRRRILIAQLVHYSVLLALDVRVSHGAVVLLDRVAAAMAPQNARALFTPRNETLICCACLYLAAEALKFPIAVGPTSKLLHFPLDTVLQMAALIRQVLNDNLLCISAIQCVQLYCIRLGMHALNDTVYLKTAEIMQEVICEGSSLNFMPTILAAAVVAVARKHMGLLPSWPTLLSLLTGYMDNTRPDFRSAIRLVERKAACAHVSPDNHFDFPDA